MWAKLDDALIDHRKVIAAGELLGKDGVAVALGFYTVALLWSNRHLSDGRLSLATIRSFRQVSDPIRVASVLAKVGLFDKNGSGFVIHDYGDFNPWAADIKRRRKREIKRVRAFRARRKSA